MWDLNAQRVRGSKWENESGNDPMEIFICIHIIGSKSKSHANLCVYCFVGTVIGVIIVVFAYWFSDLSYFNVES